MTELEALKELNTPCGKLANSHLELVKVVQALHERVKKLEETRGVPRRIGGLR